MDQGAVSGRKFNRPYEVRAKNFRCEVFRRMRGLQLVGSSIPSEVWTFLSYHYTLEEVPAPIVPDQGTFLTYDEWQSLWAQDSEEEDDKDDDDNA